MNSACDRPAPADLEPLFAAAASSPIIAAPPAASSVDAADWESLRKSNDVDAVVLAWIASHVRATPRRHAH